MRRRKNSNRSTETTEPLKVWPEKLIGAKYVRLLEKQLRALQEEEAHGNRKLFLDDVFVVYLLAFFNPTIRSLRTIEDLSQTMQAQKHLSVDKICKSTLSDFNKLVDSERLVPIVEALRTQLDHKPGGPSRSEHDLCELLKKTVAVDGTFLHAVAEVAWSVANSNNHGTVRHRARLDAQLNVSTWLPETIVVPEPGESEADSAIKNILAGRIYVYDRGYSSFALLRAHYLSDEGLSDKATADESSSDETPPDETPFEVKSHFVVRYKKEGVNSPSLSAAIDRRLSEEDRVAGVISDRVGYFASDTARREDLAEILLREVIVSYEENGELKTLRLITNLLDVSAQTIALLYRSRWQVELFFRWLKSVGHFGHLISHSSDGVRTHLYVTIIGVLLMYVHTGYRPSKYMFALLSQVAAGAATLDEILPILRERERRKELDRASAARRRAKKKASSK
ncbi:MAG: transposase [Pirellulaceae bacterium]